MSTCSTEMPLTAGYSVSDPTTWAQRKSLVKSSRSDYCQQYRHKLDIPDKHMSRGCARVPLQVSLHHLWLISANCGAFVRPLANDVSFPLVLSTLALSCPGYLLMALPQISFQHQAAWLLCSIFGQCTYRVSSSPLYQWGLALDF